MKDLTGHTFNKLTVIGFNGWRVFRSGKRQPIWQCKCACGAFTEVLGPNLVTGHTQSCGCFQEQRRTESHTIHGHARKGAETKLYRVWSGMKQRCSDPNSPSWQYYGAKGIQVKWNSFEEFLADMGPSFKPGLTIDRLNNSKHYCKENCRWATPAQQNLNYSRNRRLTLNGVTKTMKEWAQEITIPYGTLQARLKMGWSDSDALTTPVRKISKWNLKAHQK